VLPSAPVAIGSTFSAAALKGEGSIVSLCATSQTMSRHEIVMISRKCRTNHAK
jgi:hypothetical protein